MDQVEHLLIDGYNVIHAWPDLVALLERDSGAARERLADIVRIIHDFEGWRTTLVFDGQGETIEIERPTEEMSFSLVYAPAGTSADAIIERMVYRSPDPGRVTVVSGDNMVRETITVLGGRSLGPGELLKWVESCERRQGDALQRRRAKVDTQWRRPG